MTVRHANGSSLGLAAGGVTLLVAALLALLCVDVPSAAAQEAPRWIVKALSLPTHLETNVPRSEVQKLIVTATGGTYELELTPPTAGSQKTGSLPYNATAAEVQSALEGVSTMGSGSVSVAGGPGTGTPTEYVIAFENNAGNTPVEVMTVDDSGLNGGTATVAEVVRGAKPQQLVLTATNVGGPTDGSKITLKDVTPSWLVATRVLGVDAYKAFLFESMFGGLGGEMSCAAPPAIECSYEGGVDTGDQIFVSVEMTAGATPSGPAVNRLAVSGGGAEEANEEAPLAPDATPVKPGPAPDGTFAALSDLHAGAHPDIVTSFWLNSSEPSIVAGTPKDVRFDLPAGLVGSTVGMPRCTVVRAVTGIFGTNPCPTDTMVGVAEVVLATGSQQGVLTEPVYNVAPAPGEPAAFAFGVIALPVRLDTAVLSNGDYGVRVTAGDLSQGEPVIGSTVTIWGVPQEHNGPGSNGEMLFSFPPQSVGGPSPGQSPVPLMTSPQQCQRSMASTMSTDAWSEPGNFKYVEAPMGTLSKCLEVPFGTSLSLLPDTLEAGAPAGYHLELHVNQQNTAGTLATSSVKEVALKLPAGVVVNPSAAWGLKACSTLQFYGPDHPSQAPASPAECPREAKVGEVEVESPDLEHPLKGDVFLAKPECEVCSPADAAGGRMVRLFIQLIGEGEGGIIVKLEGHALIDQTTGQITTVFKETPQLPFNRMRFALEGGPRAVLANPRTCGLTKATGDLAPWSDLLALGEQGVVSDSLPFYEFEINQNCFAPQFHPVLKAGSPNIQAGSYTPFTLAFGRNDSDEFLSGLSLSMPSGLLGNIGTVTLCKEPQAAQGTCGQGSLIGHVQVLTGPGADPFLVSGGQVFLTEGYKGDPYGLSIVVPAVAGPYTLSGTTGGGTVVVRAAIAVDPTSAALTVTSDPLPTMLDGIPLQLKVVNVVIDRPQFIFNPTSCDKTAIRATLSSVEGLSASLASSFQVTNCANLSFKPRFTASTSGKTSRKRGASLNVKLTFPKDAFGKQSNIRSVKVQLPKQLPSRLETLQKSCPAHVFDENPAKCSSASIVGSVKAITPILPVPLEGPAYFVSHGGEEFPQLIMILQGYGVTIHLAGDTFIKNGVTSSTFRTVPDVPVESFELHLPQGSLSALAANDDFCKIKGGLKMPTVFTAQNGTIIKKTTNISVTDCSKHSVKRHPRDAHRKYRGKRK